LDLAASRCPESVGACSAPEWLRGGLGRIELLVTAITLGGLYAINSWDLPTYLLLFSRRDAAALRR